MKHRLVWGLSAVLVSGLVGCTVNVAPSPATGRTLPPNPAPVPQATPAPATAALSCDELTDLANALDEVANAYDASGFIPAGSEFDILLGDLVDALEVIALAENDPQLSANVRSLALGYDSSNGPLFITSLDAVTVSLDQLSARDCG